jgi:hypothetical protein
MAKKIFENSTFRVELAFESARDKTPIIISATNFHCENGIGDSWLFQKYLDQIKKENGLNEICFAV